MTYCWKALDEGYNFDLDLIVIEGLHINLCTLKVARVPIVGILGLPLGSLGTKSHLDVAPVERCRIYYKGEGGGFPQVWAVVSLVCPSCLWLVPTPKVPQLCNNHFVATPLWEKCEVATHTPENGTWESFGTLENSEFDCRGQNTLPWVVLYIVGKVLKSKCPKWPRMSHLNIYSTSYGRMKGRESNWQFDSRPLKVGNRPDPGVFRWSATHRWKALKESYKFASDLIPIEGLGKELWAAKVPGVQTWTISGQFWDSHLGVLGQKAIWMWPLWSGAKYTIWGKVVASPECGRGESSECRVARGLS